MTLGRDADRIRPRTDALTRGPGGNAPTQDLTARVPRQTKTPWSRVRVLVPIVVILPGSVVAQTPLPDAFARTSLSVEGRGEETPGSARPQQPPATPACRESRLRILQYLKDHDAFFSGVGGTAAIALDGGIAFSGAWGMADLEHRVPTTTDTRYFIASVTKAFTGVALLKLAEEGAIDLDAPIRRVVTGFVAPGSDSVTVRLVVAHLGGIRHWRPSEREPAFFASHHDSLASTVALFARDSLVATPGARYAYSSPGYNLLAAAIEAASQRRYVDYVTERILRPARLRETQFDDVRRVVPHRARGYTYWYPWFSRTSSDTLRRVPGFDYSANLGGGNMLSTAEDLVRFGSALLSPGLLSSESLSLLYRPVAPGSSWSFGFMVASDSATGAGNFLKISGSDPGFQASLSIYPKHRLVIALLNNSWGLRPTKQEPRFVDPIETLRRMCVATAGR